MHLIIRKCYNYSCLLWDFDLEKEHNKLFSFIDSLALFSILAVIRLRFKFCTSYICLATSIDY